MPRNDPPATVLILEDDPGVARLQRLRLERAGFAVEAVTTTDDALARVWRTGIDLLVLDNQLAVAEDGLAFYQRLKAAGHDLPVILVTGYSDDATIVRALRAGVRDYVFKSVEYLDYLPDAVRRILDQERTKRELAGSEALLRAVLNSARDPIITMDGQSRITLFNPAAEQVFGCPTADAVGATIDRFLPSVVPGAAPWTSDLFPAPTEVEGRRADGTPIPLEVTCSRTAAPGPALYILILRDITERKRAEAALRESEERVRLALEGVGGGVWDWDLANDTAWWSREMYDLWGVPPGTRMRLDNSTAAIDVRDREHVRRAVEETITRGTNYQCEFRIHHPVRGERWVISRGHLVADRARRPARLLGITLDITDRKRAEAALQAKTDELRSTTQQLWQAARLAGVGELAASVAHELNNPLATVHLRLEGVLARTPADDPRRRPLEVVEQEVERMAKLVANLLQFSRAGRDQVSTVNVAEEVRKTIDLTEPHMRRLGVVVDPDFRSVPDIYADRQQLRQVLLNLFTNAADAMPKGGQLTPRVRPGELPRARPAVVVEVVDTGTGIPADVLPRVFDPFFTTKEEGKGTGLGLAICKRIVEQHHGKLEIESESGQGTTVRVILPIRNGANVSGLH